MLPYDSRNFAVDRAAAAAAARGRYAFADARRARARRRPSTSTRALALWAALIVVAIVWGHVLVATHHDLDLGGAAVLEPVSRFHPSRRVSFPRSSSRFAVVRFGARPRASTARGDRCWRRPRSRARCGRSRSRSSTASTASTRSTDPVRSAAQRLPADRRASIGSLPTFLAHFVDTIARVSAEHEGPSAGHGRDRVAARQGRARRRGMERRARRRGRRRGRRRRARRACARSPAKTRRAPAAPFMVLVPGGDLVADGGRVLRRRLGVGDHAARARARPPGRRARPCSRSPAASASGSPRSCRTDWCCSRSSRSSCASRGGGRGSSAGRGVGALPVFVVFAGARLLVVLGLRGDAPRVLDRRRDPPAVLVLPRSPISRCSPSRPVRRSRSGSSRLRDRQRVAARRRRSLAVVALADLSGMSKAEVERIWLPFVPWAVLATAALSAPTVGPDCGPGSRCRPRARSLVAVTIWSQW